MIEIKKKIKTVFVPVKAPRALIWQASLMARRLQYKLFVWGK